MSSVAKYGFIIFVFNSILLDTRIENIGDFIFFGLMFVFSIYAIVNSSILIQFLKVNQFFLILIILINFFYG